MIPAMEKRLWVPLDPSTADDDTSYPHDPTTVANLKEERERERETQVILKIQH